MRETISQAGAEGRVAAGHDAHCPHCLLVVAAGVGAPWPLRTSRCPHCRLMIGPGRARIDPEPKAGARGAAAGVLAHRALRDETTGEASADRIGAAIRTVAERVGARPERLLMIDYQQHAAADRDVPDLGHVYAAFGSWKRARRAAAAARSED